MTKQADYFVTFWLEYHKRHLCSRSMESNFLDLSSFSRKINEQNCLTILPYISFVFKITLWNFHESMCNCAGEKLKQYVLRCAQQNGV